MSVEEIMTKNPAHIGADATILAAINILNELDVRHLPIVANGELVGILSDRDLQDLSVADIREAINANEKYDLSENLRKPTSDYLSGDVISIGPEAEIPEAIDLMLDHKIGALPVVDSDNNLVGIISYVDILREAAKVL